MKISCAVVSLLLALTLLTIALFASHARAETSSPACFDELLLRWNEFATDANRHVNTIEAKPTDQDKAHKRLDREWQSLKALACW
jgi:hypothetical protein